MASPPPRVSVAVLNYNGRELLGVVLPSIAAQTYPALELMVVDNASTDESLAYLQTSWPTVTVVSVGERNIGVAAALNVAVARARGELIALLNNDLELDPRWLEELVAAFDRHSDAAAVTGKTFNYWRRDELDGAGDIFTPAATAYRRGSGAVDRGQYEREEPVFAATAGVALYRAYALAEVGPFDESFFAYFEDVDWGLRAQLAGYSAWYVPTARAYHMGSRTTGGDRNPLYYELARRNTLALLVKDVPLRFVVRNAHHIAAHHLRTFVDSVHSGNLRLFVRAVWGALRLSPSWYADRRRTFAARRIELADFDRVVSRKDW